MIALTIKLKSGKEIPLTAEEFADLCRKVKLLDGGQYPVEIVTPTHMHMKCISEPIVGKFPNLAERTMGDGLQ